MKIYRHDDKKDVTNDDEIDGFNDTLMMRMIILHILIITGDK